MSDHIPPEVIVEILLRLPSKSLIRFSCVSKSWYSLIFSSDFSSMYANLHNSAISTHFIIRHYSRVFGKEVFSLHSDHNDASFRNYKHLDFPLIRSNRGYHDLVGSCNGLICSSGSDLGNESKTLVIWNPSLGVFKILPPWNVIAWFQCSVLIGFGFDSKNKDYKVVKIYKEWKTGNVKHVDVFSLNEDRWRNCRDVIATRRFYVTKPSQVFVNGNSHWLGCCVDDKKWFIVVFDLCKEMFGELGLPIELPNEDFNEPDRCIVKFGDSLSLMRYGEKDGTSFNRCCVWVMKEYGVAESWMKLYTICPYNGFWKTLELRRNGEVLLATNNGELVSYDLKSGGFNGLKLYGEGESFYVDNYVESLVLLESRASIKHDWKNVSKCC